MLHIQNINIVIKFNIPQTTIDQISPMINILLITMLIPAHINVSKAKIVAGIININIDTHLKIYKLLVYKI